MLISPKMSIVIPETQQPIHNKTTPTITFLIHLLLRENIPITPIIRNTPPTVRVVVPIIFIIFEKRVPN